AATVLQGITDNLNAERNGVLFILRGDKEKVRDDAKIRYLQNYLTEKNIPFEVIDTVLKEKVNMNTREEKILGVLTKIRKSKLVITDRFHGVIFSFIARTPVLAFKSFDTKISSGIKWFRNLPSIFYAEDESETRMKNFIDEYYFAAEEKNSVALNLKVDTDSPERFARTLDKIFEKGKTYQLQSSTSLSNWYK
ncbi:MAG: polysaccharide pyruvyl transferase family protein, partial [Selenomonadaceae bacterium]|nr:polysaccharide pyruvyl transferase family protein [Selenomonadaceae bacterium]